MRTEKWLCLLTAAVLLVGLLTGCNFNTYFNDGMGLTEMEAAGKVEDILSCLSAGDTEKAQTFLHPDLTDAHTGISQMAEYLAGREVTGLEQVNLHVSNSAGTAGTVQQEQAVFRITLSDGTQCHISAVHITGTGGEGFTSFQLILGVV